MASMKAEIKQVGTRQLGQAKQEPKASDGGAKAPASKAGPKKAAPKPQAPKKKGKGGKAAAKN
ncbi:hypothetical protein Pyn_13141 [Prunus yedoensis var. nudiflora]|uniref:Uncharacterized protein n=1 Tax=Prunus yedoensis var. nudiflora TaxID=2094558 RepID=A0A314YVA5_PRUYE|nr:hypothetical protein Pyn_13141 [Prunus yedoensis var. nudiflora]